ncbi:class I SAM-dependent methyltransferase [Azospirillum sp. TSO35-2]|uniref:class I SAM-dependent methyltransferase n=1 Tax=Azospirillum sp. TSO35-2 TaxID=716796 RepID=UPI000D6431BC|nr:class I SAM-dependent methyltransferase [Azospirillum sp. TSO35-2]
MNPDTPADDGSILYYDADYPSLEIGEATAAEAAEKALVLARMGLLGDVAFYTGQALGHGGPVLEIGCGTGRLTIPLARAGLEVWAVDVSAAMLDQLRAKLADEPAAVRDRVRILHGDAADLDLPHDRPEIAARLVLLPFNLLMLVADRDQQSRVLAAAVRHLAPGGVVALDVMNPATLPQEADPAPSPSRPRRHPRSGNPVVRHAQAGAVDARGVQRIAGWYDELMPDGAIRTTRFAFDWRMTGRAELESLIAGAGLTLGTVCGDFDGAPWTPDSRRTVVTAQRPLPRLVQGSTNDY